MSSGTTHMIIGGVCGLALAKLASTQGIVVPGMVGNAYVLPLVLVAGSAFLATLPDIDQPNSWIARHVRFAMTLAAGIISGLIGWSVASLGWIAWSPWAVAFVAGCLGVVLIGPLLSTLVLRLIRFGAGGHRRLTHSLVVAALLVAIAWILWTGGYLLWAVLPGPLAYAIVVHDIGDVVTPAGVPILYPFSKRDVGLPRPLSTFGEPLILLVAVGVGALLIHAW
jgi:membrane-bound metal-dependent hydrolase YbcI (DUF457 family)